MKQKEEIFTEELFKNPPAVYRGAPFYAWNGKLDKGILKEQINTLKRWVLAVFTSIPESGYRMSI